MQNHARSSSIEAEWTFVSARFPCPVCGGHAGCRSGFEGQFACCTRVSSEWPLTAGGWVHRLDGEASERGGRGLAHDADAQAHDLDDWTGSRGATQPSP